MLAVPTNARFYDPADFQEPAGLVIAWPTSQQRTAHRIAKKARLLIAHLRFVSEMDLDDIVDTLVAEQSGCAGRVQEETYAEVFELLELMRTLHQVLGRASDRLLSDTEKFAPRLKEELANEISSAEERLKQMRATLAFFLDEQDDIELGVELVPPPGDPRPPEESVPAR